MKNFELQPTDENILSTFESDLLRRNVDVLYFADLLNSIKSSCSIALDARWGTGKTFFVKQVKMVLDAFNEHIGELHLCNKERVKSTLSRIRPNNKLEFQPQVSVYYDAWANDNDEDPILSLVYSILQNISIDFNFERNPDFLSVAASIMDALTGRSITAVRNALRSDDALIKIREAKSLQDQVSEFLNSLLPERGNRLVVFVDELDRCNPTFAVKLLERIKHYFNNDNITFVFSVNIEQLQHTIRNYYGGEFDGSRYLDRFFDLRLDLPPADLDGFYQQIGLNGSSYVYEHVCKAVVEKNHFSIRETAKFYRMARAAAYTPTHGTFSSGKSIEFCLMFLVPIITGLKISDYSRYCAFITGKDSSPLHDILDDTEMGSNLRCYLLADNETFNKTDQTDNRKLVSFQGKLDQLYNALFIYQYTQRTYQVQIGQMSFNTETRTMLLRAVSAFSKFADYEV